MSICQTYPQLNHLTPFTLRSPRLRKVDGLREDGRYKNSLRPSAIVFSDRDWHEIGTKDCLIGYLEMITTIDARALASAPLRTFSVARRMSWAAKRGTTRVEDIAYSLMEIFDIHMPLLYGEGEKSSIRLQEEIMRNSDD